jgi:predicted ATP-binding protein involved in virulence
VRVLDALQDPQNAKPIYDAIIGALRMLLNVEDISVEASQVYIIEKSGRKVPFAALSDGYLTTAGWFLDLIARWIELCTKAGFNIGSEFLKQMRGLVLIDEIDLHLHPSWQVESIRRTRDLMPEMSFVVTTHNPLTLVGAKPEEIFKLQERDRRIFAERSEMRPMLLTSSEIFTEYFDVEDVFPAAIGQKLQRYQFLSRYALRSEDEHKEMLALKTDLAKEDVVPNWPEVERIIVPVNEAPSTSIKPSRRRKTT